MAKVKITGHASGTGIITLTAPNTSTDRTVTLPDADVTLGASPVTALNNATANELVTVGATTTELDAEANLTFDGTDLTLGTGDIVFGTAGKGVCLGVTSNTDSNTLDDYEEGTWTPTVVSGTGVSMGTIHENNYTKVGRVVTLCACFNVECSSSPGSGDVRFGGFPFSINESSEVSFPINVRYNYKVTPCVFINSGGYVYYQNTNVGGNNQEPFGTALDASQPLSLTFSYIT